MESLEISGLLVAPLSGCLLGWLDVGKLEDDDLDRELTSNARALLDVGAEAVDWVPLEDVESLVAVVAGQLGDDAALVEWAETIVDEMGTSEALAPIFANTGSLVDSTGYVVTQLADRLVRRSHWRYEGGRQSFLVRVVGLEAASPELRTILGALLARLTERFEGGYDDLRFDGIDTGKLRIFGDRDAGDEAAGESRLHRAALIG